MRFARATGGVLLISDAALASLLLYRQSADTQPEAGGLLLGRHLLDGSTIIVDTITRPQAGDVRSRTSFFRSVGHHREARRYWRTSDGTGAYLGSWHTHPEPDPAPSRTDRADWKRALAGDRYPGTFLWFLIVGQRRLRVWEGESHRRRSPFGRTRLREIVEVGDDV